MSTMSADRSSHPFCKNASMLLPVTSSDHPVSVFFTSSSLIFRHNHPMSATSWSSDYPVCTILFGF
uniref:Uncharacterized protein n=1 Tax=Arundo donax TaxID=35708 RepID=A0A0A8YHK0_ARUDO